MSCDRDESDRPIFAFGRDTWYIGFGDITKRFKFIKGFMCLFNIMA
jgi:hypothetical protein